MPLGFGRSVDIYHTTVPSSARCTKPRSMRLIAMPPGAAIRTGERRPMIAAIFTIGVMTSQNTLPMIVSSPTKTTGESATSSQILLNVGVGVVPSRMYGKKHKFWAAHYNSGALINSLAYRVTQ